MSHADSAPIPARQGPPASATPIADYLSAAPRPGVSADGRYLVLPRIVVDQLPLHAQRDLAELLATIHTFASHWPWPPAYRVGAVRWQQIGEMTEAGLREVGVIAELDLDGDLVHRDEATGRRLTPDDLQRQAPVSCPDPLYAQVDHPRR